MRNLSCSYVAFSLLYLFIYCQSYGQPDPKRELRGVWIATVKNLDWPSIPGLTSEQQKEEFRFLLDQHQQQGINAVFVQVRPAGDAFYYSATEPWSQYLTGQQGRAPEPWYDPLTFMIEETHKRGMEFHAWFNPFRVLLNANLGNLLSIKHISITRPDWVVEYGNQLYLDPGIPNAREYVIDLIIDVVNRYDIDGVHLDDYFYPYPVAGVPFPDSVSYANYGRIYEDQFAWRRNNIDQFVRTLSNRIKLAKPYVKFGISPFGIWRNKREDPIGSDTQAGTTSYDALHADVRTWLARGWLDYVAPQLYFSIGYPPANYDTLIKWWTQNSFGKHVYIGKAVFKVNNNSDINWSKPSELLDQLRLDRTFEEVKGSIYFRSKILMDNPLGVRDSLTQEQYKFNTIVPSMFWLEGVSSLPPINLEASVQKKGILLSWEDSDKPNPAAYYAVYRFEGRAAQSTSDPAFLIAKVREKKTVYLDTEVTEAGRYTYLVTALNRLHNESGPSNSFTVKIRKKDLR